jgi:hypothetical protein
MRSSVAKGLQNTKGAEKNSEGPGKSGAEFCPIYQKRPEKEPTFLSLSFS